MNKRQEMARNNKILFGFKAFLKLSKLVYVFINFIGEWRLSKVEQISEMKANSKFCSGSDIPVWESTDIETKTFMRK